MQNKHKFEQKGFGEKDKRWHTISSQREKVINIPVVDVRVNKIFINFAPNGKQAIISKCVFSLAFVIRLTFISVMGQ